MTERGRPDDLLQVTIADPTPIILSIETTTRAGSVAVAHGERILASRVGDAQVSHSTNLLGHVEDILKETGIPLRDIDLFAVATGPGSFTGLRIGIATVKAFAATFDKPCAGVQTLHAIALNAGESRRTMALLPAGRGEVFAQMLEVDANRRVSEIDSPTHIAPHKLLESVNGVRGLIWAGEGAHTHAAQIREYAHSQGIKFWDETQPLERTASNAGEEGWILARRVDGLAEAVSAIALRSFQNNDVCRSDGLQALYVRPSDAEIRYV